MLDLQRLSIISTFAELQSIAGTARALGYSPAAVSQQLSALERETGLTLLDRTARSAHLTVEGAALVRHARRLLSQAELAESEIASLSQRVAGRVVVNVVPSLAIDVAVILAQLQAELPLVEIVMYERVTATALGAVATLDADIAVTDDWSSVPRTVAVHVLQEVIATESVHLVTTAGDDGSDLPAGPEGIAELIRRSTWLCAPVGNSSRSAGDQLLAQMGVAPARRWEFEGLDTLAELVGTVSGCTLVPNSILARRSIGRVQTLPYRPALTRSAVVSYREGMVSHPAIVACIRALREGFPIPRDGR